MPQRLALVLLTLALAACGGGGSVLSHSGGSGGTDAGDQSTDSGQQEETMPPEQSTANTPRSVVDTLDNAQAYDPNQPYSGQILRCSNAAFDRTQPPCTLNELPFIGQSVAEPTLEDVMARVVSSHAWMAERFAQLLQQMPAHTLSLFKPITAIVIDDDIRPAFYTGTTGAIYIDPRYLWLSPEEAADITAQDDYRNSFGQGILFADAFRYVTANSEPAYRQYSLSNPVERSLAQIKYPFARLIYHELAHANDIVPPSTLSTLDRSQSVQQLANITYQQGAAVALHNQFPLRSAELLRIGKVLYQGQTATEQEQSYTAADAGNFMAIDGANDLYNYSSSFEDVAMLFEAVMMKRDFQLDMDMGFYTKPTIENPTADDIIVAWGRRNRIANPSVTPRAQLVAQTLLPELDWPQFFSQQLGTEQALPSNVPWYQSVDLTATASPSQGRTQRPPPAQALPPNSFSELH